MRLPRAAAAVAVLVAGVVAGCAPGGTAPPAPPGDAELARGREIWVERCARCHGADGSGGAGPRLAGRVREAYPEPADQIRVVTEGRRGMPAFGDVLDDDDIAAVVRYTREVLSAGG